MLFDIIGFVLPVISFLHGLALGLGYELLSYFVMGLYVICFVCLYHHLKQQVAQKDSDQSDGSHAGQ